MPIIKAILFDLDGTLVDSFDDIAAGINYVLRKQGKPSKSREEVKKNVGHGIRNMLRWTLEIEEDEAIDSAVNEFRDHYWDHCVDKTFVYPGVFEGLNKLEGFVKAVATNKQRRFAVKIIEALELDGYFEMVLGGDDYPVMKPDPSAVLEVCRRLGVDASNAIMVGDGRPDIESAVGAGAVACGVNYGIGTPDELKEAGAAHLISSLEELPTYINKINKLKS